MTNLQYSRQCDSGIKDRHLDQWDRIESLEINSYTYGKSIFNNGANRGRIDFFNKQCWDNWIFTHKRMMLNFYFTPYIKINLKWSNAKVRARAIKLLWGNLHDLGLGNDFLEMTSITQAIKKRINWTSSKLKTFVFQRTQKRKWKKPTGWEKIFSNHISDKVLVSEYIKNLNSTIKRQLNLKLGKGSNKHFSKEDIQMANKHIERCLTPLVILEIKIKIPVNYHFIPTRIAIIKKIDNNKFWWEYGEIDSLVANCKMVLLL